MHIELRRPITSLVLPVLSLVFLVAVACDLDNTEKIEAANQAARQNQERTTNDFGRVSIFDLRAGDCYNEPDALAIGDNETIELEGVDVVPCTQSHDFEVLELLYVDRPDGSAYPGINFFDTMFYEQCPLRSDYFIFPVPESWEVGDRVVTCIMIAG